MKSIPSSLFLCAAIAASSFAHGASVPAPNGDFSGGATAWSTATDGPTFFDFPATGGNPDGHAVIDFTTGNYAVLVSDPVGVGTLGLTPGETYVFHMDMINLAGPGGVGGLKIDFPGATPGSTGDLKPAVIGDGSTWETYTFSVTIPTNATNLIFVPLWGGANTYIGYDNVGVDDQPVVAAGSILNPDFELPDGESWATNSGFGTFSFAFPASGGNPGGHGVIDHSANDGGFGVLVSNDEVTIPLSGLGLTAGETYVFSQDMKILSGSTGNIGGFKVDFFNGAAPNGSTGDMYPTRIGDGSTWETYDFNVTIPGSTTGLKVVPLWGPGSEVGYDNITFDPTPVMVDPITGIPNGDFSEGSAGWAQVGAPNTTWSYPVAGGNPDGYGVMTNDGGGFGIWVANNDATIPLAGLGLTAGQTYVFSQDMILLSGSNIGGFKVDFFNGGAGNGSTGDMFPALIGTGATWETYQFEVSIPVGTDGIKVVPLWGSGSSVGYDNITFSTTPVAAPPIPNSDFENGGASWFELGGPNTTFSYPASGGNPGGYGVMTNDGGGFGIWVANGGAPISLASLGLEGGDTVIFQQDMILLSGTNIGGLKIEFLEGAVFLGDSGDMYPALIGNGSTWATYAFEVMIPANADHIKIVPLWGPGSSVGYDNFAYLVPVPVPFTGSLGSTQIIRWTAGSATNVYQVQSSPDDSNWTNLGAPFTGDTVTSVCDDGGPFYRVQEFELTQTELVSDPGIEVGDGSWMFLGTEVPVEIEDAGLAHSGDWSLRLSATTQPGPTPSTSILQQSTAPGSVAPGARHDFSFWANVESNMGANLFYSVKWRNNVGAVISQVDGNMNSLAIGVWTQVSMSGLVAPAGADSAFIELGCVTGAVEGQTGSVRVDDFSLLGVDSSLVGTLPATVAPGLEFSWPSKVGFGYQAYRSIDLVIWIPLGGPLSGTGGVLGVCDEATGPKAFYRVDETAPVE